MSSIINYNINPNAVKLYRQVTRDFRRNIRGRRPAFKTAYTKSRLRYSDKNIASAK